MQKLLAYRTGIGWFHIVRTDDDFFHPMFNGETLGAYSTLGQALDDLAGGHTFSIAKGVDTSKLGLPSDPGEWRRYTAYMED